MTHHSSFAPLRLATVILLATVLSAGLAWTAGEEERLKEIGSEALKPFKQQLMSALVKGLKEGPESAILVCSDQAPKIAAEAGTDTITLGRTSHRLRNQANSPEPWMTTLLTKYAGNPEMTESALVPLPDGGHGYVEPIIVRSACLKCHGEALAPEVQEKIVSLYPEDNARGFKEGDFRGLFWVKIAPAK